MKRIVTQIHEDRDELKQYITPQPTTTHKPVDHFRTADQVATLILNNGHSIEKESHQVTHEGNRLFSTYTIATGRDDRRYMIGQRNTHDKSASRGVCIGTNIMVCSNMMFIGDETISNKHTAQMSGFDTTIANNINALFNKIPMIDNRIDVLQNTDIGQLEAHDYLVQAFSADVLPCSKFKDVLKEWNHPRHTEFKDRNLWSLENAFTEHMKDYRMDRILEYSNRLQSVSNRFMEKRTLRDKNHIVQTTVLN